MLSDDRPGIYRNMCKGTYVVWTKTRERSHWQSPSSWSSSDQTRVRTDWHQLIGTAQMKRARLRHGSHRSRGSEE